jgi:hypothetical protein
MGQVVSSIHATIRKVVLGSKQMPTVIAAKRKSPGPPRKDIRARILASMSYMYPEELARVFNAVISKEKNYAIRGRLLDLMVQLLG